MDLTRFDVDEEHGTRYRLRQAYTAIETLSKMRDAQFAKQRKLRSEAAYERSLQEENALWIGLCAVHDRVIDEVRAAREFGMLLAMFDDSPTQAKGVFGWMI